jgi:hypothetical protein
MEAQRTPDAISEFLATLRDISALDEVDRQREYTRKKQLLWLLCGGEVEVYDRLHGEMVRRMGI